MPNTPQADDYAVVAALLAKAAAVDDATDRADLRDEAIERCLPLAEHIARRFAGRGEPFDDLLQVARVGVVNAVDRFDPTVGAEFLSFAVPTVMGEVRRHFRDNTWSVRVNRRAKDIAAAIARGTDELIQQLGRSPKPSELATHLDMPVSDVIDGLLARSAHSASSIDSPNAAADDDGRTLKDTLGGEDREMLRIDDFVTLRPAMEQLPERERRIIALRFFESKSQSEIAAEVGISQMHVSRLLSSTLRRLRKSVADDPPA
ncbi:SigB/SigF/SigG family RNA polymerase sigma factor [Gordonia asplenii]|uniref:SigB/SigF/SigG family RNA polymerase sigma factor n=1 Tax=Gordonia asplenii TaxID=2725283 RepID=UPI0028ABA209|nr:SigB/SigF/SigG family RNA polymerase sigma factor [Gordonia asplenii]